MAKKSKLLAALDAHKGRDYNLENQTQLQKQAERRKKSKVSKDASDAESTGEGGAQLNGKTSRLEEESDGWESDESEQAEPFEVCHINLCHHQMRC